VVLVSLFLFVDISLTSPLLPRDNDQRWKLTHNFEGNLHLVDLKPDDLSVDPLFVPETDTVFLLRTQRNPNAAQIITWDHDVLRNSNFDPRFPTHFTIHGWGGSGNERLNTYSARGFHQIGEHNMIAVDWSLGADTINYITARNRVVPVAEVIAGFIDFLHEHNMLRFEETQVMGFSLGGQVAGLVGKAVRRGKIEVIMALDPAGPLFSETDPTDRTASTDGAYVEVIHTNMGRLGFSIPIGQADFFPNYGVTMPGCGLDLTGQCSHTLAHLYYSESINSVFTGHQCSSFDDIQRSQCVRTGNTGRMGGPRAKHGLTGVFHLVTNEEPPYTTG